MTDINIHITVCTNSVSKLHDIMDRIFEYMNRQGFEEHYDKVLHPGMTQFTRFNTLVCVSSVYRSSDNVDPSVIIADKTAQSIEVVIIKYPEEVNIMLEQYFK